MVPVYFLRGDRNGTGDLPDRPFWQDSYEHAGA